MGGNARRRLLAVVCRGTALSRCGPQSSDRPPDRAAARRPDAPRSAVTCPTPNCTCCCLLPRAGERPFTETAAPVRASALTGPLPGSSVVECLPAGRAGSGCTSGSTSSVARAATTCTGAAGGAAGSRALGWSTSRAAAERVKPALSAAALDPLSCRVRAPVAALSSARARSHALARSQRSTRGDRSAGSACHRRPRGRGRSSSRRRAVRRSPIRLRGR
jgi:hypothetical protein